MASTASFDATGNREDKTDLLTTVSPEETPMLSGLDKFRGPKANLMEWQTDDNDEVTFDGTIEGSDQTSFDDKAKNRKLLSNRIQEERKPYQVTDIQEMVDTAGVASEVARAKAKSLIELKRNWESLIGSDQELQAGTGGQPHLLRALGKFINSTNTNIDSSVRTPAASIGTTAGMTESQFNDVLQSVYESAGVVQTMRLYAGSGLQRVITNYTRSEGATTPTPFQVNSNQKDREIVFSVQFYRGDYANVQVISDLFLGRVSGVAYDTTAKNRGYLINPEMVKTSVMKAPFIFENTDEGGGPRGHAKMIGSLLCKNPKGLGKFV